MWKRKAKRPIPYPTDAQQMQKKGQASQSAASDRHFSSTWGRESKAIAWGLTTGVKEIGGKKAVTGCN